VYGDYPSPVLRYERSTRSELRRLGCLLNNARLPLVGPDLASTLIEEGGVDFQLLDAIVEAKDGDSDQFKLVNITNLSDCIDYQRSEIVPMATDPNGILTFRRLVLRPEGMGQHAFSRERDKRGLILVSAKARDSLVPLKIPGLHFATPDEFFPPPKSR